MSDNCTCPGCKANRLTERIIARAKEIERVYPIEGDEALAELNALMAASLADHQEVARLVACIAKCERLANA